MTLVVKLYLWSILLQKFPYLGVCFAPKMNHSFICEDSCELVSKKKKKIMENSAIPIM